MSDWGLNLDFEDFDALLSKDDIIEEPAPIDVFVKDSKFLGWSDLSEIQLEAVKHATQIYKPSTLIQLYGEEIGSEIYNKYTMSEVVTMWGKGSGKDAISRVSLAYMVYLLHCLRNPLEYYGKGHDVTIDLVNVAVNSKQAQQVFFDPLKKLLMSSPYFEEKGFDTRTQEVFFYDKPIRMYSGHSESESWEGFETLVFVLDEISAFKADIELAANVRSKGSATEIYEMAKASVTSRFGEFGKVFCLSFPRFKGDFITTRYDSVLKDITDNGGHITDPRMGNVGIDKEKGVWACKAATWEVNPSKSKEEFDQEFKRNPIQAASRYLCEPPEAEDAFFRDPEAVRKAFKIEFDPTQEDGTFYEWFNGSDNFARFIHVDLGLKKDRAALAMVHSPGMKQIPTYNGIETLPIIKLDLIKYWEAKPGEDINFAEIRELINYLCRKFDVAMVRFDRWNSADTIQTLTAKGIDADTHSVKKADYDTLATSIYDARFRGYWNELLVEDELLRLQILKNAKIDHPTNLSNDLADAVAGATWNCMENVSSEMEFDIEIWGDDHDDEEPTDIMEKIVADSDGPIIDPELEEWLSII